MSDEKNREAARRQFSAFLKARGRRCTGERFAILDVVMLTTERFSIETFWEKLESTGYHVSVTTLYSTFQLLCEAGLLRRHHFDGKAAHYQRVVPGQFYVHLICTSCGSVKEIKDVELTQMLTARKYPRFMPSHTNVYVYGLCSKCKRRKKAH